MLNQYGPHLLIQCKHVSEMSEELVRTWLKNYMFQGQPNRSAKARRIAKWLATHSKFKSHSRHIPRAEAEGHGLVINYLEEDQTLQDLALSVFHATTHTFNGTNAVKIIENHLGRAFIKTQQVAAPTNPPQIIIPQPPPVPARPIQQEHKV